VVPPTFALIAALAGHAPDCDPARYYVLLFGSDVGPLRPGRTHTWATYVRATPAAGGTVTLDPVTVSWLPADGRIDVFRPLRTETGQNPGLHETFTHVLGNGEKVVLFGPHETDASRYHQAAAQAGRLMSGGVVYRAADVGRRKPDTSNCANATRDADPVLAGTKYKPSRPGVPATRRLHREQAGAGAFDPAAARHDWLIPALGLDRYPMTRAR
jgi:hypothetical protein